MKKIEAKANITAIANNEGRKIAISELPSIYKKDGQKVICEDGAIRSDDACFYPEGKKQDGTSRGCVSTAKVNFVEKIEKTYTDIRSKIFNDMTDDEKIDSKLLFEELKEAAEKIQYLFDDCNNRIAEQAKEAAKAKRAEAAKERATKKVGEKIAAGTDSEKIAAIAAALNVSYEVATKIYKEQKQTA